MKCPRSAWSVGLLAALVLAPRSAAAQDNQIRPFIGSTFGGSTTFVDLENGAATNHLVVGVSWVRLGDVFGVDAELADAPGFFEAGNRGSAPLVLSSRVTTVTGNVIISMPRRLTEYTLRPYFVGGAGLMNVRITDVLDGVPIRRVLPAFDLGGGIMAFFTGSVGFAAELRRFQNFYKQTEENGTTFGNERLSFWRANIGVVFRY